MGLIAQSLASKQISLKFIVILREKVADFFLKKVPAREKKRGQKKRGQVGVAWLLFFQAFHHIRKIFSKNQTHKPIKLMSEYHPHKNFQSPRLNPGQNT